MDELTDRQLERYARNVILDEVGEEGQLKLLAAKVLVVGAGGLGAPLLLYLAAAGIGTIGVIDNDTVDVTNLQRQVIHDDASVDQAKVESAARRLRALNPDIVIEPIAARLNADNAEAIIARFDLVADGSDNFTTRYLLNDLCYLLKKPLVSAALLRFEAQISTFKAHLGEPHPCYRCLFPEQPPEDLIPRCETAGILGPVAGVMGSLQATEVLKEILGIGDTLSGRLVLFDALSMAFREVRFKRDPHCPTCGH
ncbi:HesA/MoeB/ThiF family protein [Dongia rigui]|uniref:Molybdopterin-synthase adenylyltransferase MoeB n=1 Tax=Dongia rigui TaxID=940149 RepID=A0ABU5DYU5_9PROT|nr:molybdopterin-synthase adenylyltransferase MoeB [Dongia rigui]MDY0871818.1 molybdopterin-synthase adenylyltransferase MoeB [Dongia rigui]